MKTNLNALSHHCKSALKADLGELKISPNYCVWKNKNILYKIQSSLIESQHSYSIRITYFLVMYSCGVKQITEDE